MKKELTLSERILESIAIGTIYIGTIVTVFTSSTTSLTGLTLVSVGVITYVAVRLLDSMGYEKTDHIPPQSLSIKVYSTTLAEVSNAPVSDPSRVAKAKSALSGR